MAAFNFFSHGTQDLYPTFLQKQRGLTPHEVGAVAVTYNLGAILGGLTFGALSERIGRRKAIVGRGTARAADDPALGPGAERRAPRRRRVPAAGHGAGSLGNRPGAPERALPGLGARDVPGARLPAREPPGRRDRRPSSRGIATASGGNYALSLGGMTAVVAVFLATTALLGPEAKGVSFTASER